MEKHTSAQGTGVKGQSRRTERVEKGPVICTSRKQDRHRSSPRGTAESKRSRLHSQVPETVRVLGSQLAGEGGVSAPSFPSPVSWLFCGNPITLVQVSENRSSLMLRMEPPLPPQLGECGS